MTKYWEAGRVKTRLGASIGMQRAAALHHLFVNYLCHSLAEVEGKRIACVAPDSSTSALLAEFKSQGISANWDLVSQGDGSLGDRMQRWFHNCPRHASSPAILIGADCPTLGPATIKDAETALLTHDVVLGPAVDGGYYLIGIRGGLIKTEPTALAAGIGRTADHGTAEHVAGPEASAFGSRGAEQVADQANPQTGLETLFRDIPWSSDSVFSTTLDRAKSAGLSVAELETMEDVDTQTELENLRRRLNMDKQHETLRVAIETILSDPSLNADGIDSRLAQ